MTIFQSLFNTIEATEDSLKVLVPGKKGSCWAIRMLLVFRLVSKNVREWLGEGRSELEWVEKSVKVVLG